MSYLTDKFKGVYRIKCPYDLSTNDYPKKLNGMNEDIDCYIDCYYGTKVFYYGHGILQGYIPSVGRGRNTVKSIQESDNNIIFDIEETNAEVLFKFKFQDSDKIIPLLKPKTNGSNISPFSSKNLPKSDYIIPDEDLVKYKKIIENIPKNSIVSINVFTQNFLRSLYKKKKDYEELKANKKLHMMKDKEYIHYIGKWNDYLSYLQKRVQEELCQS